MINKGKRELAYVVGIDEIKPIPNYDRVEYARVGGWWIIVRKDQFKVGDKAVYIEVDSKVPEKEPFMFLEKKHFKVKTIKMCKVLSQGLLMSFEDFNWPENKYDITTPLTDILNITYYEDETVARKKKVNKYASMVDRHKALFKKPFFKKMMKYELGRKILFIFLGKKRDSEKSFPKKFEYVHVTDEERIENMTSILLDKEPFVKTTKIDGTSTTFILEKKPHNKTEFWVLSRNVRQFNDKQANYHSTSENVYWEVAEKYNIENFLKEYLKFDSNFTYVCLQGETAGKTLNGAKIQGDPHNFGELRFFGFNLINSKQGRINSVAAKTICNEYNIPWVPIIDENYILPDDFDEFKLTADGPCEAEGANGLREGYVYRSINDNTLSFKNVSNKYLLSKNE